jgi:protein phosphatase
MKSVPETIQTWAKPSHSEFELAIDSALAAILAERSQSSSDGRIGSGGFIEILNINNLVVVGDLHGDYASLSAILESVDYQEFLSETSNKMVFLGDYVDRGSNSVGVLNAVCHLKAAYPRSVVLMRGNHEAPSEFPFNSHDFPFQLVERFGDTAGRALYRKALLLFRELTLATVVSSTMMLVHGGLPTEEPQGGDFRVAIASAQQNHMKNRVLEEILWNDPRQVEGLTGWERSRRGIGRHFGGDVTKKWLRISGTKCIIRGHEPCQGFRIDHDKKLLTLFSCTEAYPAFKAAFLEMSKNDIRNVQDASDLEPFIRFVP